MEYNEIDLHSFITKITVPSYYVIDIGASSGIESDPVFEFITNESYKGLCIEGNSLKISELKKKTRFDIYNGYITPLNALQIFETYKVPYQFDILKIDIDGYDLDVLRSILRVYKPKIIIAEINEKIPPPISFEVKYKDDYSWDQSHFFGFSLQSGANAMNESGYKIISLFDLNNIICIDSDICKALNTECNNTKEYVQDLYKEGYCYDSTRFQRLWWNEDVNYWLNIDDTELLKKEITDYFVMNNARSTLSVKTKIKDIDFSIE